MNEDIRVGQPVSDADAAPPVAGSPKPFGKWIGAVNYDPDKGNRAEDFFTETSEYVKRFCVRESIDIKSPDGKNTIETITPDLDATMLTYVKESHRWKPERIRSIKDLKQYQESEAGKTKRLMEVFGSELDDLDTSSPLLNPTRLIDRNEFIPLMWGPFYKQLYIYDYLFMHSRAFQLTNHNALAAAAVKIMARFTLGRGLSFIIKHPQAREVWTEFWERNNMDNQIRQCARDLTWQGEIMWRIYEDPHRKGYLTMRLVDPSSCWEIVTDPEDVNRPYYYHFQWPTPYQIWVTGKIPVTKYIVQQIPPTNILHMKINVSAQERRGRSDLLPALPWLKRYDDFYNGATVKAVLEANLVWKIKVKGDQADVNDIIASPQVTELPPPGGTWVENEAVELTPMSAQLTAGARGSSGIGQQIANTVATSLNLPGEYFNIEGGAASRATALVKSDPAVKAIEDRQQILQEEILKIYDRVIEAAITAGRIDPSAAGEDPEIHAGEGETGGKMVKLWSR